MLGITGDALGNSVEAARLQGSCKWRGVVNGEGVAGIMGGTGLLLVMWVGSVLLVGRVKEANGGKGKFNATNDEVGRWMMRNREV